MTNSNLGNSVDNIQVTENVLSNEEHKQLIDFTIGLESWKTQPWGVQILLPQEMPKEISKILDKVFALAYEKCVNFYNVELYPFKNGRTPLVKFEKNYKMNEHADTTGDFAAIYYLNDDYDGGEINFMDHNLKIKPKANSFITFPSNSDYWHEVLENTGKERYSATQWFKYSGSSISRPALGLIR
jgi:hypothetical protein